MRNNHYFIIILFFYLSTQISSKKLKNNLLPNSKIDWIENPCYLKDYYNNRTHIKGSGNFHNCYNMLFKIVNQDTNSINKFKSSKENLNGQPSIILGEEFKEIYEFFKITSINLKKLKVETEKICQEISFKNVENKFENICLKLTYTIILLDNISDYNNSINIILSSNSSNQKVTENDLFINLQNLHFEKIPKSLYITFYTIFLIFILSYIFKSNFSNFIEEQIFNQKIEKEINLELLDTTITSLPIKNFIFTNLIDEVKIFTQKEIFISLKEYKIFFYLMFKKYPLLRDKVNETIIKRNRLKSNIIISIIQILITIFLSILTTKIISFLTFENKIYLKYFLILFSFIYMSVLILECLKLINSIDTMKYLSSRNLDENEKKFLEDELENEIENLND